MSIINIAEIAISMETHSDDTEKNSKIVIIFLLDQLYYFYFIFFPLSPRSSCLGSARLPLNLQHGPRSIMYGPFVWEGRGDGSRT